MPKQHPIRWRQKDIQEAKRVAKNFNAKINRVNKQHPELSRFQPEKISYTELRSRIATREDYNRILNMYKRYSTRGAERAIVSERGAKVSEWAYNEAQLLTETINRSRAQRRQQYKDLPQAQRARTFEAENLLPKSFNFQNMSQEAFNRFFRTAQAQAMALYDDERNQLYYENYINAFTMAYGMDEDTRELFEYLRKLDRKTFVELSLSDPVLQIDFTYPDESDNFDRKMHIINRWYDVIENLEQGKPYEKMVM